MRLRVMIPTDVVVDERVRKVVAEGPDGLFCLLPRHVDVAHALVPGVLAFTGEDGRQRHAAVDRGTLVKVGHDVLVSVLDAVVGAGLPELQEAIRRSFLAIDEEERLARTALARLEAGALRRFLELERAEHA